MHKTHTCCTHTHTLTHTYTHTHTHTHTYTHTLTHTHTYTHTHSHTHIHTHTHTHAHTHRVGNVGMTGVWKFETNETSQVCNLLRWSGLYNLLTGTETEHGIELGKCCYC